MRFAFAGDRDLAVRVLEFILDEGRRPLALLVPDRASHAYELVQCLRDEPEVPILEGDAFKDSLEALRELDLDYIIGVHFPHVIPPAVLELPRIGVLNLHPAYLPYNRGWHTPSWMILEDSPAGATLHFMDETLDSGDIVHQKKLDLRPEDTAHSLYRRLKDLELDVFREAWPSLQSLEPPRTAQPKAGSSHRKRDLFNPDIQRIDLDGDVRAGDLLRRLRALTTDRLDEAAYFEEDGVRYRVRVEIKRDDGGSDPAPQ